MTEGKVIGINLPQKLGKVLELVVFDCLALFTAALIPDIVRGVRVDHLGHFAIHEFFHVANHSGIPTHNPMIPEQPNITALGYRVVCYFWNLVLVAPWIEFIQRFNLEIFQPQHIHIKIRP